MKPCWLSSTRSRSDKDFIYGFAKWVQEWIGFIIRVSKEIIQAAVKRAKEWIRYVHASPLVQLYYEWIDANTNVVTEFRYFVGHNLSSSRQKGILHLAALTIANVLNLTIVCCHIRKKWRLLISGLWRNGTRLGERYGEASHLGSYYTSRFSNLAFGPDINVDILYLF